MDELQSFVEGFYWLDLAIGVFVLFYVSMGAVVGWVSGVVRLFLLLVALGFTYLFTDVVARQIESLPLVPERYTFKAIAGIMLLASLIATKMVARMVELFGALSLIHSLFGHMFGGVLAFVRSVLLLVLINLVVAIGVRPEVTRPHWEKSALLASVSSATQRFINMLPPGKEDSFGGELKQVFFALDTSQPFVPVALPRLGRQEVDEEEADPEVDVEELSKPQSQTEFLENLKKGEKEEIPFTEREASEFRKTLNEMADKFNLDLLPGSEQ